MIDKNYEIVSVDSVDTPAGVAGAGWHRYVIGEGRNTIQGYRRGDLGSVTAEVKTIVEGMNERRFGKRGRVHLDMSAGQKGAGRK